MWNCNYLMKTKISYFSDGPNNTQMGNVFNDVNNLQQPQQSNSSGMAMPIKWPQNVRATPPPGGQVCQTLIGENILS